ncbi:hypothetical protein BY458DRAFT_453615 [Sporodiniella umbellata]|nr:hypothetical protein BY458DRAFT_453615 [Sporodiniella umbellata]
MKCSALLLLSLIFSVTAWPSSSDLTNSLAKQGVDTNQLGCKCIMTEATENDEDETMCLCYNRKDGTANYSTKCTTYTDHIFSYCTKKTEGTKEWNSCVKKHCPSS